MTGLGGCKVNKACRPGTLFVTTAVSTDLQAADSLEVTVKRDGVPDAVLPPFSRKPGARTESIELTFAKYTDNLKVTLDLTLKTQGQVVATGEKTFNLSSGCTAVDVALDLVGGGPDLAGADLIGLDLTRAPDLSGIDLYGVDFSGVDFSVPPDLAVIAGTPGAPTGVTSVAKPGGTFQLNWTAPVDPGTAPISGYAIDSTPPGLNSTSATTAYLTPALTFGTSYTFNVHAVNSVGAGPAGVSNAAVAGDVPGAPQAVSATVASGGRATVTWNAALDNGYAITTYTIVASPGGKTMQVTLPAALSVDFTGLANTTVYSFTVTATNGFGNGPGATSNNITTFCSSVPYTLLPVETVSIEYGAPAAASQVISVMAKRDTHCTTSCANHDITGWTKFSLGSVPTWGTITSMQLNLNASSGPIGSPAPAVVVWYSKDDNWDASQLAPLLPTDVQRTIAVSAPPITVSGGTPPIFQSLLINAGMRDWSGDVAANDRYITLGLQNTNNPSGAISSITYNGFDNSDVTTHPSLDIHVCQ